MFIAVVGERNSHRLSCQERYPYEKRTLSINASFGKQKFQEEDAGFARQTSN
jgi:hypothetical protein